MSIVTVITII